MPIINSARYTQRIIQTVKSRLSEKVHRFDPPATTEELELEGTSWSDSCLGLGISC